MPSVAATRVDCVEAGTLPFTLTIGSALDHFDFTFDPVTVPDAAFDLFGHSILVTASMIGQNPFPHTAESLTYGVGPASFSGGSQWDILNTIPPAQGVESDQDVHQFYFDVAPDIGAVQSGTVTVVDQLLYVLGTVPDQLVIYAVQFEVAYSLPDVLPRGRQFPRDDIGRQYPHPRSVQSGGRVGWGGHYYAHDGFDRRQRRCR